MNTTRKGTINIYTILTGCCIRQGGPFAPGPVEGPQAPETGPGANGPPRRIQHVRVFQPVCIVFISPPGVYLSQYFACFVRVFVLFIDYTREETLVHDVASQFQQAHESLRSRHRQTLG